jgi:cbb3-type cytochrome oxidase subunit 3
LGTIILFYAAMALIIAAIFYFAYRVDKKNAWRREGEETKEKDDPLDPGRL